MRCVVQMSLEVAHFSMTLERGEGSMVSSSPFGEDKMAGMAWYGQ